MPGSTSHFKVPEPTVRVLVTATVVTVAVLLAAEASLGARGNENVRVRSAKVIGRAINPPDIASGLDGTSAEIPPVAPSYDWIRPRSESRSRFVSSRCQTTSRWLPSRSVSVAVRSTGEGPG